MLHIFVDFDGTITNQDSIVALTDRFGAGQEFRQDVVRRIETGEIDVFECIRQELSTVTAGWEEALQFLTEQVKVDPTFGPFLSWCRRRDYPVAVVSSGLDPVVRYFLKNFDGIAIFAHPVEIRPTGWIYRRQAENDKTLILRQAEIGRRVFIGDGLSDIAALPHADFVFAKRRLEKFCRDAGVPHFAFRDFDEVREQLVAVEHLAGCNGSSVGS